MQKNPRTGTVDIIVPVYNEEEILPTFYQRIKSLPLEFNLVFVDNASNDRSLEIIHSFDDVTVIEHEKNEGYGGSLADGINQTDGDIIVIIDADCEYPPESIPDLLDALQEHDVVYASRFHGGKGKEIPFVKRLGNRLISQIFNFLFRQHVTDFYTGMKAFYRDAVRDVSLTQKGYEHVVELGARFAQREHKIAEIYAQFEPRSSGYSKMRWLPETIKFFLLVVYYRFFATKV